MAMFQKYSLHGICTILVYACLFSCLGTHNFARAWEPIATDTDGVKSTCLGMYCGKMDSEGECGACPRGYQPDTQSICRKCQGRPSFYDSLYLGFMALLSLVLHWFFIDFRARGRRHSSPKAVVALHLSALVESAAAALLTLLVVEPAWQLEVASCPVQQLSDWYTMLYNPSPNYTSTLHCTQEIVYPLYTMVMIYYALSLVFLMLLRPVVMYKWGEKRSSRAMYAALYFLPILIVTQAILGGLIYYAFPYIIIVTSVITSAIHMASIKEQTVKHLVVQCVTNPRNAIILVGHWILHAYGIISLTQLSEPSLHAPLIALVPFPAIFYILTVSFSDPENLDSV